MALQSHNDYLPRFADGEKTAPSFSAEQRLNSGNDHQDAQSIRICARSMMEEEFLRAVKTLVGENIECWQVLNPLEFSASVPVLATLPEAHHVVPTVKGLEGRFYAWKEVYAPSAAQMPTASSAIDRQPVASNIASMHAGPGTGTGALGMTFVRGRGGNTLFKPGGLDDRPLPEPNLTPSSSGEDVTDDVEESRTTWRTRVFGLSRGVASQTPPASSKSADDFLKDVLGNEAFRTTAKRSRRGLRSIGIKAQATSEIANGENDTISSNKQDIDDLLPISKLPMPIASRKKSGKREWAHVVDVNRGLENFRELVPEMAHKYSFELDTFQKEAVYHLEMGDSVFVAAHTSAGKTVVAEYAISLAQKHMTRAIYTSPIKALSNQKFRDFKTTFNSENVGILTGDVQINPEASCLIMTTEILRSMLYRGADLIRDLEFVIFDEVHYVNDAERGVVWEEVIIMLPEHVNIILLSATVPNTLEFAAWVGRTKKKDIYVISTAKRPVPLKHFLWAGKDLHLIVDEHGRFKDEGYASANDSLRRKQEKEREAAGLPPLQRTGGRGTSIVRGGRGTPAARGRGTDLRGRGGMPSTSTGGQSSYGPRSFGGTTFDKNLWVNLVQHLKKNDLLPVVVFTFSKKRCEENANSLGSQDLCVAGEKSEIHVTVEKALTRLKGTDKYLPQILRMRELLARGIGVHHGGLLPIVKEVVELLFQKGLVKVLFATETFAMGVNMPAKCVVFSGIRKHDGHNFRTLLPGEYTQMAGRAGRRGLDVTGTVILIGGDELPEQAILKEMMLGKPSKLISQFRLTYNMILNLLRVEALRVEEMIKRSFSENASQSLAPEQQKQVLLTEKRLSALPKLDCAICMPGLDAFYDISAEVSHLNNELVRAAASNQQGLKSFGTGRIVTLYDTHFHGNLAVILRPVRSSVNSANMTLNVNLSQRSFWVLALVTSDTLAGAQDLDSTIAPPLWPTYLTDDPAMLSTYEIVSVETSSMSLLINRLANDLDVTGILDRKDPLCQQQAAKSLASLYCQLNKSSLPEIEWSRMRTNLDFQETMRVRNNLARKLRKSSCYLCPQFHEHFEVLHEAKLVSAELQTLKMALSDQNLELLPDYEQRVAVLKELHFVDDSSTVLLKGRVACEINSANELVLTELILENTLANYTAEEAVALLSVFVFVEKSDSVPEIPVKLQLGLETIYSIAERVERVQDRKGVAHDDFFTKFKPGLIEVVYEWARGMPFNQITELTDVAEGTIVRCITRLDETCREVRDAARVIGDKDLFSKMEEAQALIKRDIVFAASLVSSW